MSWSVVALWDSLGTLLDLEPVRARLPEPGGLEAWFERILHTGLALSITGSYTSFEEIAAATLPSTLAQLGADPADPAPLEALRNELRPHDDAGEALDILEEAGVDAWVVTNGGRESTLEALGELGARFKGIVSIDDVRSWKPTRSPYEEAMRRAGHDACLLAAHAWDVHAATSFGLRAIWIDRLELRWPLPGSPPARAHDLPEAARLAIS